METITDYELDTLFQQSAQQHKAVEQINRQVMRTVRRDMRLKTLRKWAKLLPLLPSLLWRRNACIIFRRRCNLSALRVSYK